MGKTKIEWTDKAWNPVSGCTEISSGCQNCYAKRMSKRLAGRCGYDAKKPFKITSHECKYEEPFSWKKPSMIFTCSMGDLFHKDVPIGCQLGVYETISDDKAQHHTFQILTKRPQIMADFHAAEVVGALPNLWLGVTAENQEWADKRIPILLQIPAAVRFVSLEPLLGPIMLDKGPGEFIRCPKCGYTPADVVLQGDHSFCDGSGPGIDWVIVGCETGPNRRPCDTQWVADVFEQCHSIEIPVFVKAIDIDGTVVKNADRIALELSACLCRHVTPEDIRQFPKKER